LTRADLGEEAGRATPGTRNALQGHRTSRQSSQRSVSTRGVKAGWRPDPDPEPEVMLSQSAVARLLFWFGSNGRQFHWRSSRDPYEVLLAEILLRQTRAESVPSVLAALITQFPSMHLVAEGEESTLFYLLAPLGFGRQRTKQLKQLAVQVVREHHGLIPSDVEALMTLPGVGTYTACMVSTTCFEAGRAAVDTNVARVVCRTHGLRPSHSEARKSRNVWHATEQLVSRQPQQDRLLLMWALIDVAAAICRPTQPKCGDCPLAAGCSFASTRLGQLTDGPPPSAGHDAVDQHR